MTSAAEPAQRTKPAAGRPDRRGLRAGHGDQPVLPQRPCGGRSRHHARHRRDGADARLSQRRAVPDGGGTADSRRRPARSLRPAPHDSIHAGDRGRRSAAVRPRAGRGQPDRSAHLHGHRPRRDRNGGDRRQHALVRAGVFRDGGRRHPRRELCRPPRLDPPDGADLRCDRMAFDLHRYDDRDRGARRRSGPADPGRAAASPAS